MREILPAWR